MRAPWSLSPTKRSLLVPLALGLFTFAVRSQLPSVVADDAYITFRYADHIARGVGFVYNDGERVLGTTTPLFALLLALFQFALHASPDVTSHWISAVSDAATASILCVLGPTLLRRPLVGALAALLFALSPLAIRFSINGMESALAVALMLGALLSHLTSRDRVAGFLVGLAILTRPEAILLALVIAAAAASGSLKRLISFSVCVLVVIVPWFCFAYQYFGAPLPNSLIAKSAPVYQWTIGETVSMFLSHFAFLFVGYPLGHLAGVAWPGAVPNLGSPAASLLAIILASLQVLLVASGFRHMFGGRLVAIAFPALFLLSYVLSGLAHVLIFDWYLAPLQPFYYLFISAGILSGVRGVFSRVTVPLLSAILVLSLLTGLRLTPGPFGLPKDASAGREAQYRRVAALYAPLIGRESLVAASEIGSFGYFSDARILDTVGLISPIASKYYPLPEHIYKTSYAIPPELIRDTHPDYIVTMEVFISRGLLKTDWFRSDYCEIYRSYSSAFRGTYLLVFQRIDSPSAAESGLCSRPTTR